jgi:hypothetical protein
MAVNPAMSSKRCLGQQANLPGERIPQGSPLHCCFDQEVKNVLVRVKVITMGAAILYCAASASKSD